VASVFHGKARVLRPPLGSRWVAGLVWPGLMAAPLSGMAALAGPVVCSTSLEAPPAAAAGLSRGGALPVEITRCAPVETIPELMERRFFSYTAPFARGVDLTHQITDLFGIAMGGGDGTKVMGLGFPDQTIVWDGTAVLNTYRALLAEQSPTLPWRTGDVANGFPTSLGAGGASSMAVPAPESRRSFATYGRPVRGLW